MDADRVVTACVGRTFRARPAVLQRQFRGCTPRVVAGERDPVAGPIAKRQLPGVGREPGDEEPAGSQLRRD